LVRIQRFPKWKKRPASWEAVKNLPTLIEKLADGKDAELFLLYFYSKSIS
jgi:hypothetical protein